MTDLNINAATFDKQENCTIPPLQSDFANDSGTSITVRMDKSLEFLAVDFFGLENITQANNDIFISFQTEHTEWVISTFTSFGNKAKIISPDTLWEEIRLFLIQTTKLYET